MMSIPAEFAAEFTRFPAVLRQLVEAELEAGNLITSICSAFPAPPVGACLKLARAVAPCRRQSSGGVDFYERNSSDYLAEFTDEKRHFFVLEPPLPPTPEPDMDAIRTEREARQRAADAALCATQVADAARQRKARRKPRVTSGPPPLPSVRAGVLGKFIESMKMDFDRWHDGIGYDLSLIASATSEERAQIESLLLSRPVQDWCDVEALAALDSERAKDALRDALRTGDNSIAIAISQHAPHLLSDATRTAAIVTALEESETGGGFTQALLEVEGFHPPEIIEALLRGTLARDDSAPVHFAAMLMFLHGKAESSFDWSHRPFFLRFKTDDRVDRLQAFRELCEKIGVDAEKYAAPRRSRPAPRKTRKKG
jgi:hypothetical protein